MPRPRVDFFLLLVHVGFVEVVAAIIVATRLLTPGDTFTAAIFCAPALVLWATAVALRLEERSWLTGTLSLIALSAAFLYAFSCVWMWEGYHISLGLGYAFIFFWAMFLSVLLAVVLPLTYRLARAAASWLEQRPAVAARKKA